jgi:hypothetical protein
MATSREIYLQQQLAEVRDGNSVCLDGNGRPDDWDLDVNVVRGLVKQQPHLCIRWGVGESLRVQVRNFR